MIFLRFTIVVVLSLMIGMPALAMSPQQQKSFNRIMNLPLPELGRKADRAIDNEYPDTDWSSYRFPDYVQQDVETEAAYKIAVKHSELLGLVNVKDEEVVIPCYCTCDAFGHDNLLYCFYRNGDPQEGFDEHGAQCVVCVRQALLAYLWSNLGATHEEIMAGMKVEFATLIERYHQHDH